MELDITQRAELRPAPRIMPEQIFAGRILQMPMMELEAFVRAEFQENPALLMEEVEPEPAAEVSPDDDWEPSVASDRDEDWDPFRTVAEAPSLRDSLATQFRTQFPASAWPSGLRIIESLDEDGYFRDDPLDAAARLGLTPEEFEEALARVQALDPPGIAARDVRECLLLQVIRAADAPGAVACLLAPECWLSLARRDAGRLSALTGVPEPEVREAIAWIRDRLNPYPAEGYRPEFESLAPRGKPLDRPDVIVRVSGEEVWVDCPGLAHLRLGVDPFYQSLYRRIHRARGRTLASDERHVVDHVDRARLISYAIDLRGQTLYRIADHVVQHQRPLVFKGPRFARPYTQKQAAAALGVHESTVCRAIQGKLVQLPGGETVGFDYFFDAAMPVRDLVAEIIGREDPRKPLKDSQVAEELARRGVVIARRTVAKYRDQMRILPCDLRRDRAPGA